MGTVDSYDSRLDDTDAEQTAPAFPRAIWFLVNGKEYRGYVIWQRREHSRAWMSETRSERIRYLDIFPYINKPAMLCEFDEMGEVRSSIISSLLSVVCFCCCLSYAQPEAEKRRKQRRGSPPHLK